MTRTDMPVVAPFDMTVDAPGSEAVVVHARGELDLSTAPAFEDGLAAVLAGAPRRLVIDLSRLTFISARGVDALARLHACQPPGLDRQVRLAGVPRTVHRTLRLAGVGQLFSVHETVGNALADEGPDSHERHFRANLLTQSAVRWNREVAPSASEELT